MKLNISDREKWSSGQALDLRAAAMSCAGYIGTPGWTIIRSEIVKSFTSFSDLKVVEMGCGQGKMSLVFSLLGAQTTLIDYNEDQLHAAGSLHGFFDFSPELIHGDILDVDEVLKDSFDVSMSFGTAEHFWGDERQAVFNSHAHVLRKGGIAVIWVPNRFGVLFHLGRNVRKLLGRKIPSVDETPFTRRELKARATKAGLNNIRIFGAEQLRYDFHHFIFKLPHLSKKAYAPVDMNPDIVGKELMEMAESNNTKVRFAGNHYSYPLLLIGHKP